MSENGSKKKEKKKKGIRWKWEVGHSMLSQVHDEKLLKNLENKKSQSTCKML